MLSYIEGKKLITTCRDNIDLYHYIQKRIKEKGIKHWRHAVDEYRLSWHGVKSFDEALNNLLFGNKESTQSFIDNLKDIPDEVDVNSGIYLDVNGFAYDMGSVVSGEPECCLNLGMPEPKQSINILVDFSYRCGVDAKVIINRGIAITNFINTLIAKGYVVTLNMVKIYYPLSHFGKNGNLEQSIFSICVPTENVCCGTVAFYSSVEFFRVIMILVQSMLTELNDEPGLGHSSESREEYQEIWGKDSFFIPGGYVDNRANRLKSVKDAEDYISDLFNKWSKENVPDII